VQFLSLPGGEDYILRPVLAGHMKYESLKDGSVSLADIALLNDAMDVQQENQRRYEAAVKDK